MPEQIYLGEFSTDLPFPPSLNSYYRKVRNRMIISEQGRTWRDRVVSIVKRKSEGLKFKEGARLTLVVSLFPPDKRKRDLDNFCGKALQDALQHAGIFEDDSQIDLCTYRRGEVDKADPRARIMIADLEGIEDEIVNEESLAMKHSLEAMFVSMGRLAEIILEKAPKDLMAYEEIEGDPDFPHNEFLAFMELSKEYEDMIYDDELNPLGLGLDSVRVLHEQWREMHDWGLN
mgnify:CR=1 FL=1